MPTNVTPAYRAAEARFRAAVTKEEKLACLEEMLRVVPKHKGTEKLCGNLRSRISKLKQEPTKSRAGSRGPSHRIPSEGAGQIALVGPPNSGKSTLVAELTHATPDVASYPMTTLKAVPGMMPFENIAFQLIDLPPICHEHVEPWVYDLIRGADMLWLVLSVSRPLIGLEDTVGLLAEKAIVPLRWPAPPPEDGRPGWTYKDALVVVAGMDRENAQADLEAFDELTERRWTVVPVSGVTGEGSDKLGSDTYRVLDIMRVFTKEPGKSPDRERPFTLRRGSTVGDLALKIHKDIATDLKYARLWGPSAHDGQSVRSAHVLEDGDVVEIHR